MIRRTKAFQKIFALSLLVLVTLIAGFVAFWPFKEAGRLQSRLNQLHGQMKDANITYATGLNLDDLNRRLLNANKTSDLLLSDVTEGVAGAHLQKLILTHIKNNGGVVSQIQVLLPEEDNNLIKIPISLNLTVGTKGLRDIIFDLETSAPLLFVEGLSIRQEERVEIQKGELKLQVVMKLAGYLKREAEI